MTHRNPHGFAITEMLVLLGLLGIIALSGGRLFESSIRLNRASAEAANAAASFDSMTRSLRRDAWSAGEFAANPSGVHLTHGTASVRWTIGNAVISRDDGQTTRHWPVEPDAHFSVDGPALVLRISGAPGGSEIRFVSQLQLLAGSGR